MSAYKIFISSPGDVGRERHLAEQVIRRVAAEFQDRVEVQPYFWEYEPTLPLILLQVGLNNSKALECDLTCGFLQRCEFVHGALLESPDYCQIPRKILCQIIRKVTRYYSAIV